SRHMRGGPEAHLNATERVPHSAARQRHDGHAVHFRRAFNRCAEPETAPASASAKRRLKSERRARTDGGAPAGNRTAEVEIEASDLEWHDRLDARGFSDLRAERGRQHNHDAEKSQSWVHTQTDATPEVWIASHHPRRAIPSDRGRASPAR